MMDISNLLTLPFWNGLAKAHLPELIMILTAAVVVLADRYIRRMVHKMTSSYNRILRFVVFLFVCTIGYSGLALGAAWLVRIGLMFKGGVYMAPVAAGILLVVALEAQRQRQI